MIFVIEADEYDRMFLGLRPYLALVTNVEHDHPDCYPTPRDFYLAFREFTRQVQPGGVLVACADDSGAAQLLAEAHSSGLKIVSWACAGPRLSGKPAAECRWRSMSSARLPLVERGALQGPGDNVRNAPAALCG
jgi:UDP-N-acetylmuramate--alanine ligase